tara:strand:- start:301 stop:564 length:264 start_codon:yes stop_codon:yes gene_type:complete
VEVAVVVMMDLLIQYLILVSLVDLAVAEVDRMPLEVLVLEPQVKEMLGEMLVEVQATTKVAAVVVPVVPVLLVLVANMVELDYSSLI